MKIWILILCFFGVVTAQAQERDEAVYRADSTKNREDRKFQLVLGPGYAWPFIGFRGRAGFFLDRDSIVFFDATSGVNDLFSSLFSMGTTSALTRSVGYKRFIGNSFYLESSVFHRRLNRREYFGGYGAEFESQAIGTQILIGNQWQWQTFTLGVDWLGVHVPFKAYGHKVESGEPADPREIEIARTDFNKLSNESQIMVLGFYIGWSS